MSLPLNFNSFEAEKEFHSVMEHIPENASVYLVGGSLRNALIRHFHNEILVQRDYDQVITAGTDDYLNFLESRGYERRPNPGNNKVVIYCKALNDEAKLGDSYINWLVFDLHKSDKTNIEDNLKYEVGLTINGFAINGRDIFAPNWQEKLIMLPGAINDIKNKQLRINHDGYKHMASNFFAVLRFMSAGFAPPPKEEVQLLLQELPKIESDRFEKGIKKVWDYVGGEAEARKLVNKLEIDINVFNEAEVRSRL